MKLRELLFADDEIKTFQVDENNDLDSAEFSDWFLQPLESAETLSAEAFESEYLDGYFIVKAIWVKENGELENCYLTVAMPERISEEVFIKLNDKIVRKWIYEVGEVVPAVAIEGFGNYELFYSKMNPEIGIKVLREGLKAAKNKAPVAEDLAYILRDEGRIPEAIEAFTMVIDEGDKRNGIPNQYTFEERAGLFEKIGNFEKAAEDLKRSKQSAEDFKNSIDL